MRLPPVEEGGLRLGGIVGEVCCGVWVDVVGKGGGLRRLGVWVRLREVRLMRFG